VTALLAAVVIGVAVAEFWFRRRRSAEFLRGVLAGQWQSDLTHGLRLDVAEPPPSGPAARRRSPDVKAERQPPPMKRPVFHD
jgi:hypothetical protein